MEPATFLARALEEGHRYGADPYVFLRELAQNARDANAAHITVVARTDGGLQSVVFEDDGDGMSFEHARRYLFRLYASSKEDDPYAAGHFGVGFWSVLQWRPDRIRVESRTAKGDGWALALDAGLRTARETNCSLSNSGSRITLQRSSAPDGEAVDFTAELRDQLFEYCRFLRRSGRSGQRLAVHFNGKRIDQPLGLDGPIVLRFSRRGIEGVVGLADEPSVELYARGLLVKKVAFLEELEPGVGTPHDVSQGDGLSPVVLLNSDDLDLVLSRRTPLQNRALRRAVRIAKAQVRRLIGRVVDQACPRTPLERLTDGMRHVTALTGGPATLGVLAVWVVAFVALILWLSPKSASGPANPQATAPQAQPARNKTPVVEAPAARPIDDPTPRPYGNVTRYYGATVNVLRGDEPSWGLSYRGPAELFFRALTLDRYDAARGLLRGDGGSLLPYAGVDCRRRRCIRVALSVAARDDLLTLPLPTGYGVDVSRVRFRGKPLRSEVLQNDFGEALLRLPASAGALQYEAGPVPSGAPPERYRELGMELPPGIRDALDRFARQPIRKRVRLATAYVRNLIAYDVSADTAAAYRAGGGAWLERVLDIGAGDCDVKNGLNVLALRYLGVPSRMAVGIAARCDNPASPCNGRARAGLHAWTEYFHNGRWRFIDASGPASVPPVAGAAGRPTASREARKARPTEVRPKGTAAGEPAVGPLVPSGQQLPDASTLLSYPNVVWLLLPALLLLTALVLWRFGQVRESLRIRGGSRVSAEALARILKDALTRPRTWRVASGLLHRRVLPTIFGRPMSVADAIARARSGKLWLTRGRSALAQEVASAGTPVLDGGDGVFGNVINVLGHGVDLDALDQLQPTADSDPMSRALADEVNRVLKRIGVGVTCQVCPGLTDAPVQDVDLSGVRLAPQSDWPRRFIGIAPHHKSIRQWGAALQRAPVAAGFAWIDWLLDRSELLVDEAARIREAAAYSAIHRTGHVP